MSRLAPIAALIGGILLLWDQSGHITHPDPPADAVEAAFVRYEALWRKTAATAAEQLTSGQLATDRETRDWLAAQNQASRRDAFAAIAATEQEQLAAWTAEKHASVLRGYAR